MSEYLSDYYDHEPAIGLVISFSAFDGSHTATFTCVSLSEGECTPSHCSHCAGWELENIPDEYYDTEYRRDLRDNNTRQYYSGNIYHEAEADEILNNMLLTGDYEHRSTL